MIKIYVTYDTNTFTWNVMNNKECLFYGTAEQVDTWLKQNDEYKEVK